MLTAYDLIVIGAGPGGYPAALKAAELGKRVAVVEKGELGGTCLNRGCIPTKTLLHTTGLYREAGAAAEAGLEAEHLRIDGEKLRARKCQVVCTLRDGIAAQFKKGKIDSYIGTGTIEDDRLVSVCPSDGSEKPIHLEAQNILIATGSGPAKPPIPGIGLEGVTDSDGMLEEVDLAVKHLIIIGGGVIGMEFAQMYSDIGCQVTVLEAMERILPGMDKEIAQNLKMISKKRGVDIHTGATVKEIKKSEEGLTCIYAEGTSRAGAGDVCPEACEALKEAAGDKILIATGRRPNTEGLLSEHMAGRISLDRGYIQVDESYSTGIPGIYAIGDVIGGIQLAHAATAEGITAVEAMYGLNHRYRMDVVPSCVYTDPEIATVGMNADDARAAGISTATGKYIMSLNGKSVLSGQERGFIKLVARKDNHELLGAQLMCARATDMVGELSLAIQNQMTAEQAAGIIMPHPTFCEGIGEAAEAVR